MSAIRHKVSGVTPDGQKFRPSDWTERLVCIQPEQLKRYNGHLKVGRDNGIKYVEFDDELKYACPVTYERILSFAKINHLQVDTKIIDDD